MRRPTSLALAALALAFAATPAAAQFEGAADAPTPFPADTIYQGARIKTPSGWADSIAIARGTIVAVGGAADVVPYRGTATKVVDLSGATVLPGLYDMHVHAVSAGLEAQNCQLPQGAKPAEILTKVKACVAAAKPGEWVRGGLWDASTFGATPPDKAMLDAIAPTVPVAFSDSSHHSAWVNSAALKAAGITRDTPNPTGGIIERDRKGEPTGLLRENAAIDIYGKAPLPTPDKMVAALRWASREMLALGITGFEDALIAVPGAQAYATLYDQGELPQHVRLCLWDKDQAVILSRQLYRRPTVSPSCVKLILDGVPTDAHTAAMHDPYTDLIGKPSAHPRGDLLIPPAEIAAKVIRYDGMGMTVKLHAAGDAAVSVGLDAIAAARAKNGTGGAHHEIAHNSFVAPADFGRARALNATLEFSPYIWFPIPIIDDIVKTVGAERMRRFTPVREALDAGVMTVIGSDWPVVPAPNPWVAIETLVTRQMPGGGGTPVAPDERITVAQAVDLMTRGGAEQLGLGDRLGTIERGKQADLIVIDQNVFEVAPTTIHRTKVLRTIIDGKEVYRAN